MSGETIGEDANQTEREKGRESVDAAKQDELSQNDKQTIGIVEEFRGWR